ncbi:MAG: hypothetical protein ACRC0M_06540 [Legionella sp.]
MPNEEMTVSNDPSSVCGKVLEKFIAKLASNSECSEISARLNAILYDEHVSDKLLQIAIFGEEST